MQSLNGRVVAITGASSGIGRALAVALAKQGCRLALSDINEAELQQTAKLCAGAETHCTVVDVAENTAMQAWADAVVARFGAVHVIVNNAGVALNASVEQSSYEDLQWLMGINFWGVVHGTRAFLPHLQKNDWGHVVNVSSLFGLVGIPNQSAYNAAKFAVRGYTESLQLEMAMSDSPVGVSCVHPGGVATNIANSARHGEVLGMDNISIEERNETFNKQLARTTPDESAAIIIKAIRSNSGRVLVGWDARLLDLVQRLFPSGYRKIVAAALRGR